MRDRGKARRLARNWIDGRRNIGEFFWPIVIVALVFLIAPIPQLQAGSTVLLLGFYVLVMADTAWSLLGLRQMPAEVRSGRSRPARGPAVRLRPIAYSPAGAASRSRRSSVGGPGSCAGARSRPRSEARRLTVLDAVRETGRRDFQRRHATLPALPAAGALDDGESSPGNGRRSRTQVLSLTYPGLVGALLSSSSR